MNILKRIIFPVLMLACQSLFAQSVIVDQQVRAGNLILMQSVQNENEYYYIPDQARLAKHENGVKQFSFLRYVEPNVVVEVENNSGAGGGIVHAVVEILVSDNSLQEARNEIQRIKPGASIVGPVTFSSGTFALISSFADTDGEFTDTVVGIGSAPLLEGGRAAVSLKLTKKGAEVLWESFQTTAPDISFSFEMDIDGFRAPQQARLKASWSKVYSHQNFAAGIATPYLQAEIDTTFEELRNTGAIELTQVGSDEDMNKLIETAYDRLTKLMFESAGSTGTTDLVALANNNEQSMLDKASSALQARRTETREDNTAVRERNNARGSAQADAAGAQSSLATLYDSRSQHQSNASSSNARAEGYRAQAARYRELAEEAENQEDRDRILTSATGLDSLADKEEDRAAEHLNKANNLNSDISDAERYVAAAPEEEDMEETESLPSLSVVASYRMKQVKQSGEYDISLNKYAATTLKHRFDQNIGDLRSELSNENVFRTVDLSNSAFAQREVPVYLDGLNSTDFSDYVNFVTVLLEKKHDNGSSTTDDIRIDRANFNLSANNFKLSYRRLGDSPEGEFLDYKYKTIWNFFGGAQVETEWINSNNSGIGISPPYQKRSIFLEADPGTLTDAKVRSIEFKLHYDLGGVEKTLVESLRPDDNGGLSKELMFMLPESNYDYDYEVSWRVRGASERPAISRTSTNEATLFLDEIPGGE